MVQLIALLALGATNGPVFTNAEMRGKGAAILTRDIENVKTMRTRVVNVLPETVVRDSVVLGLDENLPSIPLRRIARDVPIMLQHAQVARHGTDTTVFMGYGPQDDDDYDSTAAGAKLFYDATSNPSGIKLNLTRKFAQLCDLVVTLESTKRSGQALYHGVQVTRLLPGLLGLVAITIGHESMHAAQYQTHPALDLDSHRSQMKEGQVPPEALDALRWERAYEQEAFTWEYALAVAWKNEIATAADAMNELRQRDPEEFAKGARFEFLAAGRRNELVQHYMRDELAAAESTLKRSTFAFTGMMHLLVDSTYDVPAATNALIAANDEAVVNRGPKVQELRVALAKAEKIRKEYFDQGEMTNRMLEAHPFLKDVMPRLDREIERARGRLMGARPVMLNDPRVTLLTKKSLDRSALRAEAMQLLEAGHDAQAQEVVDVLLALGDAHPTVLLVAAALAEARGDVERAKHLAELCLPHLPEGVAEFVVRWSGQ